MNANMKRLLIFALVPVTVWGIGSTFTKQKIDRIGVNTESQITMEDTTRFSSGTASTVPYLDANKDFVSSSVTPTELGYLSGVTSSIQTQIDSKQDPVSGTANEIDVAADIIGLADNPILPGLESVTIPAGADGDRPSSPVNGMIRYNTTSSSFEGYQAGDWGELGGGSGVGGSRLQLISDPSFEEGVAEGTCTGCTATQDTTDKLGTDNNLASLKMAFSASSGNYTLTKSTSAQYSNVAGVVSAWIKTSASDCHFDELVDGTQSQTVAIGSSDEWKQYIINGTTGTTSYGWRVRCDTAITDDVFVDETFAGAAEPDVFDIGTASEYGSIKWSTTTGCAWAGTTTSGATSYAAVASCDDNARTKRGLYNSTDIGAGESDGQYPKIEFDYLESGIYKIVATGMFYRGAAASNGCSWTFYDGTSDSSPQQLFNAASGVEIGTPNISGTFSYTTDQTSGKTFEIRYKSESGATCNIYTEQNDRNLEISVYHYPAPQKVVAAKCDGLECENSFSIEMTSDGSSNPTIENQTPSGWVDSITKASTTRWEINVNNSIGSVLECWTSTGVDDSGVLRVRESEQTSSMIPIYNLKADTNAVQNFSTYTATGVYKVYCRRQGSDYKQFDQRFIPVVDEFNTEWVSYTPVFTGFGTVTGIEAEWRRVGSHMEIRGKGVAGTPTATEARISLADSKTSKDSSTLPSIRHAGDFSRSTTTSSRSRTLIEPSVTYITFGGTTGNTATAKLNGNSLVGTGDTFYFSASVPISGWSNSKKAFIGNLTPKEFVQTPGSTKPVIYSAFVSDGAGTTTVSKEYSNWINGNCTNPAAGDYVCAFEAGAFSQDPNCQVVAENTTNTTTNCVNSSATTSSVSIYCRDNETPANQDNDFMLICHGVQ